jgi:hypothetical protein
MKKLSLLLLVLTISVTLFSQKIQNGLLKWGDNQWLVKYVAKPDTFVHFYTDNNGKVAQTSTPVTSIRCTFDDMSVHSFDLGGVIYDTGLVINPITMEEAQNGIYKDVKYNINGGKISLNDIRKLSHQPFELTENKNVQPTAIQFDIYSATDYTVGIKFIRVKQKEFPVVFGKGSHVVVSFYYYDMAMDLDHVLGKVLFEII